MAVQKQDGLHTDTGVAATDQRGKEFLFVSRQADGTVILCPAGGDIDGVISEGRNVGYHTSFNTKGNPILKVIAGGAIARNDSVQSGALGVAITGATKPFGFARNAAAAGEMVEVSTSRT